MSTSPCGQLLRRPVLLAEYIGAQLPGVHSKADGHQRGRCDATKCPAQSREPRHLATRLRNGALVRGDAVPCDSCRRTSCRMASFSHASSSRAKSSASSMASDSSWRRFSSRRRRMAMERPWNARAIRAPKDLDVLDEEIGSRIMRPSLAPTAETQNRV